MRASCSVQMAVLPGGEGDEVPGPSNLPDCDAQDQEVEQQHPVGLRRDPERSEQTQQLLLVLASIASPATV
jgi:hypothetical protein